MDKRMHAIAYRLINNVDKSNPFSKLGDQLDSAGQIFPD